jgi:hypothetical protein
MRSNGSASRVGSRDRMLRGKAHRWGGRARAGADRARIGGSHSPHNLPDIPEAHQLEAIDGPEGRIGRIYLPGSRFSDQGQAEGRSFPRMSRLRDNGRVIVATTP